MPRSFERCALGLVFVYAVACSYDFDAYISQPATMIDGGSEEDARADIADGNAAGGVAGSSGAGGTSGASGFSGAGGTESSGGATMDAGPPGDSAPGGFDCSAVSGTEWSGRCYFAIAGGTGLYWGAAKDACESYGPGTHLVTITSTAEQQMLEANFFPSTDDHWIGLSLANTTRPPSNTCNPTTCPFRWITGETLEFTAWGSLSGMLAEPNYSGACVRIRFQDQKWADFGCSAAQLPAICETG